jgi:hypothetical protein
MRTDLEKMFPDSKLLGAPTYSDFRNLLQKMNRAGYFDSGEDQGYLKADGSVPMIPNYEPTDNGDIVPYDFFKKYIEMEGPTLHKTLGPNGDFKDFNELYDFCNNRVFPAGSILKVEVEDGVHRFQVDKAYLFEIKSTEIPIEIYGSSTDNCIIEIEPAAGNTIYKGGIHSALNTWSYIHHLSIKEVSGSDSAVLLYFEGSASRISDIKLYGGGRALLVQYNASLIGWNLNIYDPAGTRLSTFKAWGNSNIILWYGVNIFNDNGNPQADGIFVGGNSSLQINYTNFEIRGVRLAIQPQWGGIMYFNKMNDLKIVDSEYGFKVQDHSYFIGDKDPIFTNVNVPFENEKNTVLKDGSYTFIARTDFKFENGFINSANGTAELLDSEPSEIQAAGDKAIPTLEYLLSSEFGNSLPTVDPGEPGRLWNDAGVLKISQ